MSAVRLDYDLERDEAHPKHSQILVYRELPLSLLSGQSRNCLIGNVVLIFRHSFRTWPESMASNMNWSHTSGLIGSGLRPKSRESSGLTRYCS